MKKFSVSKIDDDILSEIIGSCEKKMVSPFKKKESAVEVVVDEEPEESEVEEGEDEASELKDKLSEMDLEELKDLYSKLKD